MFADLKKQLAEKGVTEERAGISKIVASHVAGVRGSFGQFFQYTQNSGDSGGPATGGGAFWQAVFREFPDPPPVLK